LAETAGSLPERSFDVCIVGGGVLGTCLAFWVSELLECKVALVDMESKVAIHASSRNTGVVHRPFYMNPEKKRRFARAANRSFGMWERLAKEYSLPWRRTGIVEVAIEETSLPILRNYLKWAGMNGMREDEMQFLDSSEIRAIEPLVECRGGVISKNDAAVDYRKFTECVFSLAQDNGVKFIGGMRLKEVKLGDGKTPSLRLERNDGQEALQLDCGLLVNTAGGGALQLAHSMGLAREYAELHFRGDYWAVRDPGISSRISHSIYSVPKRSEYPFLDPHLVLREDGRVEIGPNAAMVGGPYVYDGFTGGVTQLLSELVERPMAPKLRLLVDSEFLSLVWEEWRRSISKEAMCDRVREFVPTLGHEMLGAKAAGGVRNSLVSKSQIARV